jgi:OmpA-OmpF porin, OOP family
MIRKISIRSHKKFISSSFTAIHEKFDLLVKSFLISIFLLICFESSGQREKIKTYYKNGQLESKGFRYTYPVYYDAKMPDPDMQMSNRIAKKGKEWKYWYQNGQLRRIENYKFIKDKNPHDLPNGNWEYFNETGVKYREDTYSDGVLINSTKEIYNDSQLVGKITLQNGTLDTSFVIPLTSNKSLIINPDFEYYYYKPVPITYNGRTKIDEWIPFWVTPGNYTPDYLSNLRSIDVLSNNQLFDFTLPDKFTYAGFALYKELDPYSEYIQGKLVNPLIKGQKYCIKVSIALTSYSGFSVNLIAFHLSPKPIAINEKNESTYMPQVRLSTEKVDNKSFTTLCDYFVADGGEKYISIGRFSSANKLETVQRANIPKTGFGIENSAYYYIDKVELNEIQDIKECHCNNSLINKDSVKLIPDTEPDIIGTDLTKLKLGNSVILKDVNFEFDSFKLLPISDTILKTLLTFLRDNPKIKLVISGHTDDIGTEEYNLDLSINRAKSVYNWLINNGIDSTRLDYKGFGKSVPLYKETDEKFRALNRRVEVKISDTF